MYYFTPSIGRLQHPARLVVPLRENTVKEASFHAYMYSDISTLQLNRVFIQDPQIIPEYNAVPSCNSVPKKYKIY